MSDRVTEGTVAGAEEQVGTNGPTGPTDAASEGGRDQSGL